MEKPLLGIGFGNTVVADRVVAILTPSSSPMKRIKDQAKEDRRLIDVTHGRKNQSHHCDRLQPRDSVRDSGGYHFRTL